MTEHINLKLIEGILASVVLPYGNSMPSPFVVISDDAPLYDEPHVLEELENAAAEDRPAAVEAQIVDLEAYNPMLITVTFTGENLNNTYKVNIPRQLLQVGYMYNRLMKAPACALITESELNVIKGLDFDNAEGNQQQLPPFTMDDILVRLVFPEDIPQATRMSYNHTLNNFPVDYSAGASKDDLRDIYSKVRLVLKVEESQSIRTDIAEMLLGLSGGDEEALVKLYEYAEHVDSAKESADNHSILSDEERKSAIIFEFLGAIVHFLKPENLVERVEGIEDQFYPEEMMQDEDEDEDDDNDDDSLSAELESLLSDDLTSDLNSIIAQFRQENPESNTITPDSSPQERIDYLSLPSNEVPLMGGLKKLEDKLNTKLYYSADWNRDIISEEEYGTRGEFMMVLSMLAVQRIQMFAKCIDIPDDEQQVKTLVLSMVVEALTPQDDDEVWFFREALQRVSFNQTTALEQFLMVSLVEPPHFAISKMLHSFGHFILEEGFDEKDLMKAFAGLPLMCSYLSSLFEADGESDDDDDDDNSPVDMVCLIAGNATMEILESLDDDNGFDFAKEVVKALVILTDVSLETEELTEEERNSQEWQEARLQQIMDIIQRGN